MYYQLSSNPKRYLLKQHSTKILSKKSTGAANAAGEDSSFTFTVCVKSVPLDHFKLAYVILHMAVKEFFETHF